MLAVSLNIAFVAIALAMLLNGYRLAKGPAAADRVLALDTLYINTIGLMVLLGLRYGTDIYFEAALIIAMMGFISTIAFARYLLRGNILE
jgi:multicomponent K+:H+ antiporter subunit F